MTWQTVVLILGLTALLLGFLYLCVRVMAFTEAAKSEAAGRIKAMAEIMRDLKPKEAGAKPAAPEAFQ